MDIGLLKQYYATPSELLLIIIAKEYTFFYKTNKWGYPHSSPKLNTWNIWIIKPSSNARGNGIYLQTDMQSIIKSAKGIQSRIIQKYIFNPLLFSSSSLPHLNQHKFDFRQWVLLKSINPLQIYMFSHFYLRLSADKYQLYPIQNLKVHLTNYSTNKKHFKKVDHSILSSQLFQQLLNKQFNIQYKRQIKPLIIQIIIKSIKSCQQKLQSSTYGTCFQLLGYDIMLDQNMKPWLLEVNMSPACQERVDWLSQYLKYMNQGLIDIVLFGNNHYDNHNYNIDKSNNHNISSINNNKHNKQIKLDKQQKYKWQLILKQDYYYQNKDMDIGLQIVSVQYLKNKQLLRQTLSNNLRPRSSFEFNHNSNHNISYNNNSPIKKSSHMKRSVIIKSSTQMNSFNQNTNWNNINQNMNQNDSNQNMNQNNMTQNNISQNIKNTKQQITQKQQINNKQLIKNPIKDSSIQSLHLRQSCDKIKQQIITFQNKQDHFQIKMTNILQLYHQVQIEQKEQIKQQIHQEYMMSISQRRVRNIKNEQTKINKIKQKILSKYQNSLISGHHQTPSGIRLINSNSNNSSNINNNNFNSSQSEHKQQQTTNIQISQ